MKKIFKKYAILLAFLITACDLDGDLTDPNQVPVDGADVNYIMNLVQLNFADFYANAQGTVAPLMRHTAMSGGYRYQLAYQPQFQDGLWSQAYQGILLQSQLVIKLATEKGLTTHVAAAKLMSAYTYLTLVDLFGDVPDSEAIKASEGIFNPTADPGEQVYDHAIDLIDEALAELGKTGADVGGALSRDIYYNGSRANWTAFANTLKLKAYQNLSKVSSRASEASTEIGKIVDLSTGTAVVNIIDAADGSEDFTYKYGTATVPAGSRHPLYDQYYGPSAGTAGGYIANYLLYEMFYASDYTDNGVGTGNAIQDPRWRYYFYRQVGSINPAINGFDQKALGCTPGTNPTHYVNANVKMFCVFEPGFYGRDHGDASGTPPDGPVMTAAGVYPAGGRPDLNGISATPSVQKYSKSTARGDGANGAGIQPIWMAPYTKFLVAEMQMAAGNTAGAKASLISAINSSVGSVKSFADKKAASVTTAPWSAAAWTAGSPFDNLVSTYTTAVGLAFDASATPMNIIGKEFWKALWGNSLEAYNLYRRTGAPAGMQPTIQTNPGPWMRTLVYPSVYVNLNSNATQRDANAVNKVFWDTNSATLD